MAYSCDICGKGKQFGHNVPFSQKKTNKVWKPNLQTHHLRVDGHKVQVKICTQCLRTLAKFERATTGAESPAPAETPTSPETNEAVEPKPTAKKKPATKAVKK